MLAIRTILHATDYSERSDFALHLACSLARDYRARLVVLHVASPSVTIKGEAMTLPYSEEYLAEERKRLNGLQIPCANLLIERRLAAGSPAEEILRVARDISCDLIVLGTHGRTGLTRMLVGSVAEQVLRQAPCPVLTVRTPFPQTRVGEEQSSQETIQAMGIDGARP